MNVIYEIVICFGISTFNCTKEITEEIGSLDDCFDALNNVTIVQTTSWSNRSGPRTDSYIKYCRPKYKGNVGSEIIIKKSKP